MDCLRRSDDRVERGVVIFSGYNQRAVVALCRTLKSASVPFFIVASSPEDSILLSSYKNNVAAIRRERPLVLEDIMGCLEQIAERGDCREYVIAPSSEALNIFLLKNRQQIAGCGCIVPLVDLEAYKRVSDKSRFNELCRSRGLSIPEEITSPRLSEVPFVAKPKSDILADGLHVYPHIIRNGRDYRIFEQKEDPDNYFFQRYIYGESYYLLYYITRSGAIEKFSQRNLVQQPRGKSIVAAESADIHLRNESQIFEDMLLSISFHGLVMIEIRIEDSNIYVIEANPRMWGPSQLMVDSGANLLMSMVNEYCGNPVPEQTPAEPEKPTLYCWIGGFCDSLVRERSLMWHCDRSLFVERYGHFMRKDVYLRQDTKRIFTRELHGIFDQARFVGRN